MRLPALAALLLLLVAGPAAAVGAAATTADTGAVGAPAMSADGAAVSNPPTTADVAAETTISGTVSHLNGTAVDDATVLVGNLSRFENASTDELRDLAANPPDDVATATTNASGGFVLTAGESVDAEAVVAVSADGVSRVRRYQSGTLNLTVRTTEPLAFESTPVTGEPGGRATVTFSLASTGEQPVEGLKLTLGSLPDGWNVASTSSASAAYHDANRTFTWGTVEPGETVAAELTLFISLEAIDEESTAFEFPMFAGSDTHPVEGDSIEVTVRYPTEETRTELPGFDGVAMLAALGAGLAVLAALKTRRRG